MTDCIFCKIVNGEIPSKKVFEDEFVTAFLDISQVTPGHTLLVPKKHVKDLFSYDEELAEKTFRVLPELARAVKESTSANGLNIVMNNGTVADQSVFHSHIHLIPRYTEEDDFHMTWTNNADNYTEKEMDDMQQAILSNLEG